MLQYKWYQCIEDVDKEAWNHNLSEAYALHHTSFLKVIEQSKINNAIAFYLCVMDNDKLVCSAVLSIFEMNISLFVAQNAFVTKINRLLPRLFSVKLLFCGTPVSTGTNNLWIHNDYRHYAGQFIEEIERKINELAPQYRANGIAYKEFTIDKAEAIKSYMKGYNYELCTSLPTVGLEINRNTLEEYLFSLKNNYRRQITSSLKKINFTFRDLDLEQVPHSEFSFKINIIEDADALDFYNKYKNVMDRAKVKFETLNHDYFHFLFQDINIGRTISLMKNDQVISSFLFLELDESLIFLFVSKESYKDEYDSYFNLMFALINYGIKMKKKSINLGQTTYYTKLRFGGKIDDLFLFFKFRNPILNRVFRRYSHLLFPQYSKQELMKK